MFQALEKAEEAMQTDKSLGRYREEQNMNESDLNLTGCVRIIRLSYVFISYFEEILGHLTLCKYVYKMWYEY